MHPLIAKFMALTAGFFIAATILKQPLIVLINLIVAPLFGQKVKIISIFGYTLIKTETGWESHFQKLTPLCQVHADIDIEKRMADPSKDPSIPAIYTNKILNLIVCYGLCLLGLKVIRPIPFVQSHSLLDNFVFATSVGLVFESLVSLIFAIHVHHSSGRGIIGYINDMQKQIIMGRSFEELQLFPVEHLPFTNVTKAERKFYYNLYLPYLLSTNQIDAYIKACKDLTTLMTNQTFVISNTGLYYHLIYFYSKYEIDPKSASYFKNECMDVMSKDHDSNAYRVQAQYALTIEGNKEKAYDYLQKAYAGIEKFSMGAERELEKRFLKELENDINK